MNEDLFHLAPESKGNAPGRGRLIGRRILVVGGGQQQYGLEDAPIGNGRAMCLLFAREGATVAVADQNLESAQSTCRAIGDQGGNGFAIRADVRNPDEIQAMVEKAWNDAGGLDGLVYNVGTGREMFLQNVTAEGWDFVLSVNLRGAALTLKAALSRIDDGSSIVLISSTASLRPGSRIPAYDSSKAALAGLMRHAAFEGARRYIRVNVVAPGLMDTAIGRVASKGRPSRSKTPIPLGRQGTGWETAYASLFLISRESAYITGQVLSVDGGLSTIA
ncbi:MAG: SDR family oxidoreductase [Deltaproteobacteria bacterium]|nr:SDR family oxidoreductase [Deltaproteobacteria bacterium]